MKLRKKLVEYELNAMQDVQKALEIKVIDIDEQNNEDLSDQECIDA